MNTHGQIYMYADDLAIVYSAKDYLSIQNKINADNKLFWTQSTNIN